MNCRLSVIIPNRNGEKTIGKCLEKLFRSDCDSFEVTVVDDCSADRSVSIIEKYPCRLIKMEQHVGAARARNIGAMHSCGEVLFFTDADCLVFEDTLSRVEKLAGIHGADTVIGGTYTCRPYDRTFYSSFQSAYIHYSELKNISQPDYIASHAMVISSEAFHKSGGFPVDFLPIIEDVEFSHRLRRQEYRLVMAPELQVCHVFGYSSLFDSLKNGYRKSRFWTIYSLGNKDLLTDSGTASLELKINVLSLFGLIILLAAFLLSSNTIYLFLLVALFGVNVSFNLQLFSFFYHKGAKMFFLVATFYYMLIYPFAVGVGAITGVFDFVFLLNHKYLKA